jgi:GNAT superfamily N-acetyltransferase
MELLQRKAEPYVTEYGENKLPGAGQLLNSILRTGTEMVPGVGDLLGAEDLQTAAQNNDWGGIGLGALAAIPGIPSFSRGAGGDIRATARAVREAAEAAPAPRVEPMTESDAALARYRAVNPNDTGARVLNPGDEGYPTNAQWDEASQTYVAPRSVEDLMARAEAMGAKLDISQGNNGLTLSRIVVPPSARSQGVGSRIMRDVENYADSAGLPVGLTPSGDFGGSVPRLNEFYRRFGFMPNRGRSRDFSTRETMLRQPREVAPVAPVEPDYPIRAFHGSPHSFDRFSLDKIGTGEGAQAYGHGLYFAESEDVARGYRDTLADQGPLIGGRPVEDNNLRAAASQYRTVDDYISALEAQAEIARQNVVEGRDLDALLSQAGPQVMENRLRTAREYAGQEFGYGSHGSMYEVGINSDPNTFLDWDRPLSEQPENVRAAFDSLVHPDVRKTRGRQIEDGSLTGPGVLRAPLGMDSYSDAAASAAWRDAGIPGIRYLDGNSRGVGEGSSNYVVFNDDLVKILRKYGIGGLSTTVGASALAEELDRRGQTQEF